MKKPYFIGIAGGSASGKSTFCSILEKGLDEFQLKVFHMDDYFKAEEDRPFSKSPVTDKWYVDDNHPETIHSAQLHKDIGEALESGVDAVILEGLFVLMDEVICPQLDLKLFVDCRADERIVRRLRRNMAWGLTFDEIAGVYVDLVRFRHDEYVEPTKWKADYIINGSVPSKPAADGIVELIRRNIIKAQ